jgi:gluconokinase
VNQKIVVMGVSGSGKSTLGEALARLLHARFIEGDEHHLASSREKMRNGIGLGDADREPWLELLASIMADETDSVVLSCSALKRSYREKLRRHVENLKFVFLDVAPGIAMQRVIARTAHEFPASLVAHQFEALESPEGEPNVLAVHASDATDLQLGQISAWLDARGYGKTAEARARKHTNKQEIF